MAERQRHRALPEEELLQKPFHAAAVELEHAAPQTGTAARAKTDDAQQQAEQRVGRGPEDGEQTKLAWRSTENCVHQRRYSWNGFSSCSIFRQALHILLLSRGGFATSVAALGIDRLHKVFKRFEVMWTLDGTVTDH